MQRQTWSSTLTYILTVAGATIGFGATWRFPYLVGENGGGAYVLVFCVAMILIGIPVILAENVIGRKSMTNSVDAFKGKWKFVGYMGLLGSFGIMAYYMVLGGWVFVYIFELIIGNFNLSHTITKDFTEYFFNEKISFNPLGVGIFTTLFVLINYIILRRGIIDGIEKSVKFLMPLLFICLILVVGRNLSLEGAINGVKFYLTPDFDKILSPKLLIDVLGQVFFALSLGFGVMITLSSHLSKNENMAKTAIYTGVLNTLIAVLAGFMIFPALFAAGLEPDKGPSLVFQTLPIYQVIISVLEEKFKLSKKTAINLTLGSIFILGNIPCILTYGPWRDITLIKGKNIFDSFDFISGNILFVLTAFFCCIYVGWVLGKEQSIKELSNEGKLKSMGFKIWFYYIKFIIPLIIFAIFIYGIAN